MDAGESFHAQPYNDPLGNSGDQEGLEGKSEGRKEGCVRPIFSEIRFITAQLNYPPR